MTMFSVSLASTAGYVASIYSRPRIKSWVNGAKAEITRIEARAAALKSAL